MPETRASSIARSTRAGTATADPVPAASPVSIWIGIFIIVSVGRASELVPGGTVVPFGKVAFLIAAIVAYVHRKSLTQVRFLAVPQAVCASWVYGIAMASIFWSIYRSATLHLMDGVLVQMLAFWLIIRAGATLQDLTRILRALVISGALLTFGTLMHYQGGRAAVQSSYDTNDLAYVLVTILPVVAAFMFGAKGFMRLVWAGTALAMLGTILLTQSRGGVIGLLAMVFTSAFVPLIPSTRDPRVKVGKVVGRILLLVFAAIVAWFLLPDETRERLATLVSLSNDYNTDLTNQQSRLTVWTRNVLAAVQRPIGYGMGTFPSVDGMFGGHYRAAHNSLVQIVVELGFVGLFFYLRSYYLSWKLLKKVDALPPVALPADGRQLDTRLMSRALRLAIVGNFFAGFFLSQGYAATMWTMMAIIGALLVATSVVPVVAADPRKRRAPRRRVAAPDGKNT